MDNNIYDLEKYKQLLELQKKYDNDFIEEDELSLEEINSLITLYKNQIKRNRPPFINKCFLYIAIHLRPIDIGVFLQIYDKYLQMAISWKKNNIFYME